MNETIPPIQVLDYARPERKRSFGRAVLFVMVVLLGAGIGMLIAWKVVPVHYVATELLIARPELPNIAHSNATHVVEVQSFLAFVQSPATLNAAQQEAAKSGISPSEWAKATISVKRVPRSELIFITVTHPNAASASAIARAMVNASIWQSNYFLNFSVMGVAAAQPAMPAVPQWNRRFVPGGAVLGALLALSLQQICKSRKT